MKKQNDKEGITKGKKSYAAWQYVLAIILLLFFLMMGIGILIFAGIGLIKLYNFLSGLIKNFVDSTDKVIVVAMITGTVSIVGVVISSIVARIVDYKYNVKRYLYDKREEPYKQFIEMIYSIMEDSKKNDSQRMSEEELTAMVSSFSKGLTLWGSNRVVKKWLKYRKNTIKNSGSKESLLQLEDIIYEIRRDIGAEKRLKKGDMLSFFVNDIEDYIKNN